MRFITGGIRLTVVALVAILIAGITPSQAQTGRVHIEIYKAGWFVGVSGGRGTLTYQGRVYPFSVGGVSLGLTFGASKTEFYGTAYNLRSPWDLNGIYTAAGAGLAVAGGGRVAQLRNSRGVVLSLQGRQIGLQFSLDLSGMNISMR